MHFSGFTVSSVSADPENKSNHSCQTLEFFFWNKKGFLRCGEFLNDLRSAFWSCSAVECLCALSGSCLPHKEFTVNSLDYQGSDLMFSVSACLFCFWYLFFLSTVLPLHFTTLSFSFLMQSSFHSSLLLLQCFHLVFILMPAEYKPNTLI